ncbi:MAG: PAS domain-containing protein [Anaerolineae bacterium]|nr:PAS domain-containing protein [Anaerolineae bacterium]
MAERLKILTLNRNRKTHEWFLGVLDPARFECRSAKDLAEFRKILPTVSADVIVLGLPWEKLSDQEAISMVAELAPETALVALVESAADEEVLKCIESGAHGFLRSETLGSKLVSSVLFQAYSHQRVIQSVNEGKRNLQNLIGNLPGFIYRCRNDQYWTMEYISGGFKDMTGRDPEDFIENAKMFFEEIIHPDDRNRIRDEINKAIKKGNHYQLEYRLLAADNSTIWVWEQGNAPEGFAENAILEGFIVDITEKKMHEDQLHVIISMGEILGGVIRLTDFSRKVLEKIAHICGIRNAAILIANSYPGQFTVEMALGGWESLIGQKINESGFRQAEISAESQPNYIDLQADHEPTNPFIQSMRTENRYLACMTLKSPKKPAGMIVLGCDEKFSAELTMTLKAAADMVATAIERANLYQRTEKQLAHLESLHAIDQAITSVYDIQVINKIILDQACRALEADAADILILNEPINALEMVSGRGFIDAINTNVRIPITTSTAGKILLENQQFSIPNLKETPLDFNRNYIPVENFTSYYARPISLKGKTIGVFEVFFKNAYFPEKDWEDFFEALTTQIAVAYDSTQKYSDLQKLQQNMAASLRSTIETWSKSLELHDIESYGHIRRVTNETLEIAKIMGIEEDQLPNIERGALLHDIGKLAIMDGILQKKGTLTEDEWKEIKRHPEISREMLSNVTLLEDAVDIPYSHHENWDGSGYPQGLKGENIPLAARIFAVVETYDAMISPRPYRAALTKQEAIQYLIDQKGKKFDPRVVDLFLETIKTS